MQALQRESVAYDLDSAAALAGVSTKTGYAAHGTEDFSNLSPLRRPDEDCLVAALEWCRCRLKARSAHAIVIEAHPPPRSSSAARGGRRVGNDEDAEIAFCVAELVRCRRQAVRIQLPGVTDDLEMLGVPLPSPEGRILGALVVVDVDASLNAPFAQLDVIARRLSVMIRQDEDGAAPSAPILPDTFCFRRVGEYWAIGPTSHPLHMKDTRGLHYIAELLRNPKRELHACSLMLVDCGETASGLAPHLALPTDPLAGANIGFGASAEPLLDRRAKQAYKQRLTELRGEIDEAESYNDIGRLLDLRRQYDLLLQHVSSAVGLGGRDRSTATPAERARLAVTKRIKEALRRITLLHPDFGDRLSRSIRTGYYCSYVPERANPMAWEL